MKTKTTSFYRLYPTWIFILFLFFTSSLSVSAQEECVITGETEVCLSQIIPDLNFFTYVLDYELLPGYSTDWQVAGGVIDSEDDINIVINWGEGNNIVIARIVDEFENIIAICTLEIMAYYGPFPTFDPQYIEICEGATVEYAAANPCENCSYLWEYVDVEVDFTSPNSAITDATFSHAGEGQICLTIIDNNGCDEQLCRSFEVADIGTPMFEIIQTDENGSVCSNQDITFDNTSSSNNTASSSNIISSQWDITDPNGNVVTFYGIDPLVYSFSLAGDYEVTLTEFISGQPQCRESTTRTITVQDLPPIEINCPSVVCEGDIEMYSVDVSCGQYLWEVINGEIVNGEGTNTIQVEWTNEAGSSEGYVIFEGVNCDAGYCTAPSIVTIPIFPGSAEIQGNSNRCKDGTDFFWWLPSFFGAEYSWSYFIMPPSFGSLTESCNNCPTYQLTFSDFSGVVQITGTVVDPISGCTLEAYHEIEVLNNNILDPDDICLGESATIILDPAPMFFLNWSTTFNGDEVHSGQYGAIYTIPESALVQPGLYFVNVELEYSNGNICNKNKSFSVVEAQAVTSIDGPLEVCLNTQSPYTYGVPPPTGSENYYWEFTDGTTVTTGITTEMESEISYTWTSSTGPYSIEVIREITDPTSCFSEPTTFDVTPVENEELTISGNNEPCPDALEIYTASLIEATTYDWQIENPTLGSVISGQNSPQVEIQWLYVLQAMETNIILTTTVCGNELTAILPIKVTPFELEITVEDICAFEETNFTSNVTSAESIQWFLDDEPIPAPEGTNPTLIYDGITTPGYHSIKLEVVDPEGCPGGFAVVEEILVYDNPVPFINPIPALPCPEDTPFNETLIATPYSEDYNYTWYLNGDEVVGVTTPYYDITETGTYQVGVEYPHNEISCKNFSEEVVIDYDCGNPCTCPEGPDFDLRIIDASFSDNCGFIDFSGEIDPFENAIGPYWYIVGPGYIIDIEPILNVDDLSQTGYAISVPGIYYISLVSGYICQSTGDTCLVSETTSLEIPFLTDFIYTFECVNNEESYNVILSDMSSYFEDPNGVSYEWIVNGISEGTSNDLTLWSVPPGSSLDICLTITSEDFNINNYDCEICKAVSVPDDPEPIIVYNQTGLCTEQLITFTTNIPQDQILELLWDFGDNSLSQLYEVSKVYSEAGPKSVTLEITTIHGCELEVSEQVFIVENTLNGYINIDMMDCDLDAELSFNQAVGPPISSYEWNPQDSGNPITVTSSNIYSLTVTDANGCKFTPPSKSVLLTDPFFGGINGKTETCRFLYLWIPQSESYEYYWSIVPDEGYNIPNPSTYLSLELEEGTYTVTVNAFGENETICASEEVFVTVYGIPDEPILEVSQNSCEPNTVTISVTNHDEVQWYGPGISGLFAQTIVASQPGNYNASYTDENGCQSNAYVSVNDIIDFSDFLTGCYDMCTDELPFVISGIPGSFDSWEWHILNADGSLETISGTGIIDDLPIESKIDAIITLVVNNGECTIESGEFTIKVDDCPKDCDFTLEGACTTCSCGTPHARASVYDINGNLVDPNEVNLVWYYNGDLTPFTGNPHSVPYEGPANFTVEISFTQPDGSLCEMTLSVTVICGDGCPQVTFATCDDEIATNFPECENYNGENSCEYGGFSGYVWVIDEAGNPLQGTSIDWYDDGSSDTNPVFINFPIVGGCDQIPVQIGDEEACIFYYEPDCCGQIAPEISCNGIVEGGYQINWTSLCGTESYLINAHCSNGSYSEVFEVPGSENSITIPFPLGCDVLVITVEGVCSSGEVGPESDCILISPTQGCFELGGPCFGGGGQFIDFITEDDISLDQFNVYPNPIDEGDIHIEIPRRHWSNSESLELQMLDVNGRKVKQKLLKNGNHTQTLSVNDLIDGVFLVTVTNSDGQLLESARFVKRSY